jgi:thioredoxin 1
VSLVENKLLIFILYNDSGLESELLKHASPSSSSSSTSAFSGKGHRLGGDSDSLAAAARDTTRAAADKINIDPQLKLLLGLLGAYLVFWWMSSD